MFIISATFHVCHRYTPGTTKRSFPFRRFFHPSVPSVIRREGRRHDMAQILADMSKSIVLQGFFTCPDGSNPSVGACNNFWQTWDVAEIGGDDLAQMDPTDQKMPSVIRRGAVGSRRDRSVQAFRQHCHAVKHH